MHDTRYRFWGRTDPAGRRKPAIRAELLGQDAGDGVTKLFLYDVIDSWGGYWGTSAREFVEALAELPQDVEEIRLHINSPGGEVYEGIAINNALRTHPARVVAVVDGLAASAASFIAAGADELVMGLNTELMIHDAWGIAIGPAETMTSMAGQLNRISDNIAGMYQRKAGGDLADWRALMLAETWYSDREAVDAGLADRVDGDAAADPDDGPAGAVDAFDLGQFKFRSRAEAPPPPAAGQHPTAPPEPHLTAASERHARRAAARFARRTPTA